MSANAGDRFWVPHPQLVFAPLPLHGIEGSTAKFVDGDGVEVPIPAGKLDELSRVHDTQLTGVDNVCTLEEVNQAAVLHAVRTRYHKAQPQVYTRVARIVIAVNPFRALPIYSAETMRRYLESPDPMELPPHLFAIGQDAILGLKQASGKNQAVLISGESGAGKTESTKLVLSYVAEAVGSSGSGGGNSVQDKIMQTNPVLEAFGNAMTVRNNNSSRFGKWLQMTIADGCRVQGCSVTDYLLELTRVCRQGEKERNYHVFFQLIAARSELAELKIGEPQDYRYLKDAQFKAPGIDDKRCFEELQEAFTGLGVDDKDQMDIFKIVAGILCLGNCDFADQDDAAKLLDSAPSAQAAELLGMSAADLEKSMLVRTITVGRDVTETGRTAAQAVAARDGLSRLLYGKLFKLLVARINTLLSGDASGAGCFFGVLDIAGFESFEKNSLEQLWINLSNEHLQNHFNNHVFKMELEDYKSEGISLEGCMDFQDNSDIIALLDSKGSVLAMLDDELAVPKATDATYGAKVVKAHEKHPRFVKPKFAGTSFGIRHFAGEVTYSLEGWMEKNVDKPPDEATKLFQASGNRIVQEIGGAIAAEVAEAAAAAGGYRGGGKKTKTVSLSFRQSLASLVQKLSQAEPHFIRCVKSNAEKVPEKFTSKLVMDQLNCSGVFEAVRIRQSGFATRMPFAEFIGRYRVVVPRPVQKQVFGSSAVKDETERAKIFVDAMLASLATFGDAVSDSDIRLGKSKVFARSRIMHALDRARDLSTSAFAVVIQKVWRGHQVRKLVKECYVIFDQVKAWRTENPFYQKPGSDHMALAKLQTAEAICEQIAMLEDLLSKSDPLPLAVPNRREVEKVRSKMRLEAEAMRSLKAAATSLDPMEVDRVLLTAKELELPAIPELELLHTRFTNLKTQLPLVKAIEHALESEDVDKMQEVMGLVKKHGLHQHPENWVEDLNGEALVTKLYGTMESIKEQRKQEEVKQKMHEALVSNYQKDIDDKKAHLEVIEPKEEEAPQNRMRANTRRSNPRVTITGLTQEGQQRILLDLQLACEQFDVEALEKTLSAALSEGIAEDNETMMKAEEVFAELQTKDFVFQALADVQKEINDSDAGSGELPPLKRLQNLTRQAQRLGAEEAELQDARALMQSCVKKRARHTLKGHVFDHVSIEELEIADAAFADLSLFPGLKPVAEWKGHQARLWFGQGRKGAEFMLMHAKHGLRSALTKLPQAQEAAACAAYYNILCWMGDKPVPEVQRAPLASMIAETAQQDQGLANEVYIQLMKQLSGNPSTRSVSRGWELMLTVCQKVCPSSDLHEYLHVFLIKALSTASTETTPVIRQCIADLNITASPSPEEEHIETFSVALIDFSTRRVRAPRSATLKQLGEILANDMRISRPEDFACFMLTEGISHHRLLPDTAAVSGLLEKWKTLKEKTGRNTSILYKRKLLTTEETLQPGDWTHANLTYRQALFEYLHYPICEGMETFYRIAASVLWADRDHFKRFIEKGYMAHDGVLEQILPEESLQNRPRRPESMKVLKALKTLESACDGGESRLVGMSRAFAEMQKLKMFGAYYWPAKQVFDQDKERVPISKAPGMVCTINPKATDAQYYLCVDHVGVHFVAQASGPNAQPFHRLFQFNKEAVERVINHGVDHSSQRVAFVVSTLNSHSLEIENMTVVMHCAAAVDVAFGITMVQALRSDLL